MINLEIYNLNKKKTLYILKKIGLKNINNISITFSINNKRNENFFFSFFVNKFIKVIFHIGFNFSILDFEKKIKILKNNKINFLIPLRGDKNNLRIYKINNYKIKNFIYNTLYDYNIFLRCFDFDMFFLKKFNKKFNLIIQNKNINNFFFFKEFLKKLRIKTNLFTGIFIFKKFKEINNISFKCKLNFNFGNLKKYFFYNFCLIKLLKLKKINLYSLNNLEETYNFLKCCYECRNNWI
ncbi:hypothetical protein [Candidatus Vidania fulgoroideorum]